MSSEQGAVPNRRGQHRCPQVPQGWWQLLSWGGSPGQLGAAPLPLSQAGARSLHFCNPLLLKSLRAGPSPELKSCSDTRSGSQRSPVRGKLPQWGQVTAGVAQTQHFHTQNRHKALPALTSRSSPAAKGIPCLLLAFAAAPSSSCSPGRCAAHPESSAGGCRKVLSVG